jgi:NAD(P)-dependent dehydrogenase (short-subunit alcohol dehydrogenase family)
MAEICGIIVQRWGSIDILVNNAALFATIQKRPFHQIPVKEFQRVLDVNVTGQFVCVTAAAPYMQERKWGRIVNISSGAALKGLPGFLHYVTSKGAMIAFTRALARELGEYGITVNAIAPGLTLSEGVLANPAYHSVGPHGRAIPRDEHPADLIGTLMWLCSEGAEFVTGQTIAVDGGSVML